MRTIGGFLGLEQDREGLGPYHGGAALSTGRSCLRLIVDEIRPRRVHLPFYVCDAVLDALRAAAVRFDLYALDENLVPTSLPDRIAPDELYLIVNYFGLQGSLVSAVGAHGGPRVVIDDSQAFFHRRSGSCWVFNSVRKFFGVPDGAYLDGPRTGDLDGLPRARPRTAHLRLRHAGEDRRALREYRRHEESLDSQPRLMSRFTARTMAEIDYAAVAAARRRNYRVLDELLGRRNGLAMRLGEGDVPYCYPFLAPAPAREALIGSGVFVPHLWAEVVTRAGGAFAWERDLAERLCPLPVDHRYDGAAMHVVASRLLELLAD